MTINYSITRNLIILVILFVFASCSPKMSISFSEPDIPMQISFSTGLDTATESAFKTVIGENDNNVPLFSVPAITKSLCETGFTHVVAKETGSASFQVSCALPLDGDMLIPFAVTKDGSKHTLSLSVTADNIRRIIALFPDEFSDYADLMMAPLLTSELMSVSEYVSLIDAAYGKTIATNLVNSAFEVSVTLPDVATSGSVTLSGESYPALLQQRSVLFRIPVVNLLAETEQVNILATW